MTFLSELSRLREAATKGPWSVFSTMGTTQIDFDGKHGERPCIVGWSGFDSNDLRSLQNKCNAEYIAYLVNHAEAIEELIKAAEMWREFPNTGPASTALISALEKLNRSEHDT